MLKTRRTKFNFVVAVVGVLAFGIVGFPAWASAAKAQTNIATFGAPFNLIDDRGQPITERALQGHPSLIYFGYTHCPEVCPTTLYDMMDWFKTLGPEAGKLKAYFFTVDPERDTLEIMRNYMDDFSEHIAGVTGDPREMQKVIDGWRIYAVKVPSQDGDYSVDHSTSVLLVDDRVNVRGFIYYGEDKAIALQKIDDLLGGKLPILPGSPLSVP